MATRALIFVGAYRIETLGILALLAIPSLSGLPPIIIVGLSLFAAFARPGVPHGIYLLDALAALPSTSSLAPLIIILLGLVFAACTDPLTDRCIVLFLNSLIAPWTLPALGGLYPLFDIATSSLHDLVAVFAIPVLKFHCGEVGGAKLCKLSKNCYWNRRNSLKALNRFSKGFVIIPNDRGILYTPL